MTRIVPNARNKVKATQTVSPMRERPLPELPMSLLPRLVSLLGVLGAAAVILFVPRRVPITNTIVHPYLLGNDLALKLPISWPMLVVYLGVVIVITGLLSFLIRGRP